jgi:steroid delta-isomerase-like uncharacterized protein
MVSVEVRQRREAVVREHMESENASDFDTTIATFGHPRYELVATGDVFDGEEAVRAYFAETRRAFPDQRNELVALHHADDAVIVEFDLVGTHLGPLRALPPTGRAFRCRMSSHFVFDGDRLVCERVYFDRLTIMQQLGLAHDSASVAGRRPRVDAREPSADSRSCTAAPRARSSVTDGRRNMPLLRLRDCRSAWNARLTT